MIAKLNTRTKQNVLFVAAHPDDELLGCAGSIALHANQGDNVHTLIVSEGATSRVNVSKKKQKEDVKKLQKVAKKTGLILGVNNTRFLGFPDNKLDSIALLNIIQKIEAVIEKIKPKIVYTHFGGDLNIDHRIVNKAVITACRPLPGSTVRSIYLFETVLILESL